MRTRMRIFLLGSYYRAVGHTFKRTEVALQRLGCEVHSFDYLNFDFRWTGKVKNRILKYLPPLGKVITANRNRAIVRQIAALRPDVVLVLKGETLHRSTLDQISTLGCQLVNWSLDNPLRTDLHLEGIEYYEHFFVFDPAYIPQLLKAGVKNAHYLACATDPTFFCPMTLTPDEQRIWGSTLCFVGNYYDKRGELLARLREFDPVIWGGGWKLGLLAHPELRQSYRGYAHDLDTVRAYNAAQIVLNQHHEQSLSAPNMRTFEVAACRCFQLVENLSLMPTLFEPQKEIITYSSVEELISLIWYYLKHDSERKKISEAGYRRVLAEHTYGHRIQNLLSTIN